MWSLWLWCCKSFIWFTINTIWLLMLNNSILIFKCVIIGILGAWISPIAEVKKKFLDELSRLPDEQKIDK